MAKPRSVVVVGGGIIGMCAALALQERGLTVIVADAGDMPAQASWGSAGRIAVELSQPLSSLATLRALPGSLFSLGGPVGLPAGTLGQWLPFGLRFIGASAPRRFAAGTQALTRLLAQALPAWRRRLAALNVPHLLLENGHYSIWEHHGACARGQRAWRHNAGAAQVSALRPEESACLRGLIATPIAGALRFSGTASIADMPELHARLRAGFLAHGGTLSAAVGQIEEAQRLADEVVVAAGLGSAPLLRRLGHAVPLIAERGYHIQQEDPQWPADLPPLFFEERSLVVTRFKSALRATSFVEFTAEDAAPDKRKWARLRRHARELGLPFGSGATEWMGSRPTLPDYLPALGRSRRGAVTYAFGHQHLGLTLAAITGELVAQLLCESATGLDLEVFDLERFA